MVARPLGIIADSGRPDVYQLLSKDSPGTSQSLSTPSLGPKGAALGPSSILSQLSWRHPSTVHSCSSNSSFLSEKTNKCGIGRRWLSKTWRRRPLGREDSQRRKTKMGKTKMWWMAMLDFIFSIILHSAFNIRTDLPTLTPWLVKQSEVLLL